MTTDNRPSGVRRPWRRRRPDSDDEDSGALGRQLAKRVEERGDYVRDIVNLPGKAKDKAKGLLEKAKRMAPKLR